MLANKKAVQAMVEKFMADYGVEFEGALIIASEITGIKLEVLKKEIKHESNTGV